MGLGWGWDTCVLVVAPSWELFRRAGPEGQAGSGSGPTVACKEISFAFCKSTHTKIFFLQGDNTILKNIQVEIFLAHLPFPLPPVKNH